MSRESAIAQALGAISERMLGDRPNHQVGRQLQGEVNRLRQGAEALARANANRSPLDTPAAHTLKVAKMARKLRSESEAMYNRTVRIWVEGLEEIQRRIDDKINLKPDAFAAEIRTAFRELDSDGKSKLVTQLIDEGRGPELAAILRAPSVLSGISDEQRKVYETRITTKHAGDLVEEMAFLDEVYHAAGAAERAAVDMAKGLTDPGKLAQIEREAEAASAAGDAFNQSLQ